MKGTRPLNDDEIRYNHDNEVDLLDGKASIITE